MEIIKDFYKMLKIDKTASLEEIMKAYIERVDYYKSHFYQDCIEIIQLLDKAKKHSASL